jgi:hypothetical protein
LGEALPLLPLDQAARLALAAAGLLLLALAPRRPLRVLLAWRHAAAAAVVLVVASKLVAAVALYHWAGLTPPSDVPGFYVPWAQGLAAGGLPYREVAYAFQPFFAAYLLGIWELWPDPRGFVAAALLCHALGLLVLRELARPWLSTSNAALLILLLGLDPLLTGSVLMGQDESFVILLTALALLALQRGRHWVCGLLLGIQFLATKLVVAVIAAPLGLAAGWRGIAAGTALVALGYGFVLAAGLDPLFPMNIALSTTEAVSHGNLPYLLTVLGLPLHANLVLYDGLLLAALLLAFGVARGWQVPSVERATLIAAILMLTWLLVSRKSWYELLLIPLLPVLLGRWLPFRAGLVGWLALSTLAALDASYWFSIMRFGTFETAPAHAAAWLFLPLEITLVGLKAAALLGLLLASRRAAGQAR